MRLKQKYRSCFWCQKDIWGDIVLKRRGLLRQKWDPLVGKTLSRYRLAPSFRRGRYRASSSLVQNYKYIQTLARPNQTFNSPRWGYRTMLSNQLSLRRFYGDIKHRSFKRFCRGFYREVNPSQRMLEALESRLDICLYRLGYHHSIYLGGQSILHKGMLVNGIKTFSRGQVLKRGDIVEFCLKERPLIRWRLLKRYGPYLVENQLRGKKVPDPNWLFFNWAFRAPICPKWIQSDHSSLSFLLVGEPCAEIGFPFRADIEGAQWAAKYGFF